MSDVTPEGAGESFWPEGISPPDSLRRQVSEAIRGEIFVTVDPKSPLIEAAIRKGESGVRELLSGSRKSASDQTVARVLRAVNRLVSVAKESLGTSRGPEGFDQFIERAEQGMLAFEGTIKERSCRLGLPRDPWVTGHLEAPFEVLRINQGNPQRNYHRFREAQTRGLVNIANPHFFFYDEGALPSGTCAGFGPASRTMIVARDIDPANLRDMLVFYHELKHAALDGNIRTAIQSQQQYERYMAFHTGRRGEKPRSDITQELLAYGSELEVMDLLFDGALRAGRFPSAPAALRALNARDNQRGDVELLLDLARLYFPHGMHKNMPFPQGLTNKVQREYQARGYDVCILDQGTLQWQSMRPLP